MTTSIVVTKTSTCGVSTSQEKLSCTSDSLNEPQVVPNNNVMKTNNNTFSSRLLGHFVLAAKDLRMACKLDFDEIADEWLKEVTPNVSTFSLFVLRLKVGIS